MTCNDFTCPNRKFNGYCGLTACSKHNSVTYTNTKSTKETLEFPCILGYRRFNTIKELEDWAFHQQFQKSDEFCM